MQSNFKFILKPLVSWLQPRHAVAFIYSNQYRFNLLNTVIILAFIYYLQGVVLLGCLHLFPKNSFLLSWEGGLWLVLIYIVIAIETGVVLNLISIILHLMAKLMGGVGSFYDMKLIVFQWSFITVPIISLFLLFVGCGEVNHNIIEQGLNASYKLVALQLIAIIGILCFFIYGVIVLGKMFSEIHKISIWSAFPSVFFGLTASSIFAVKFYYFFNFN